ncbi:hypothetical protein U3516DRAFT_767908 [Neocallimastix sp. 'constans']
MKAPLFYQIQLGVDTNTRNEDGKMELRLIPPTCYDYNSEMIKSLLDYETNINIKKLGIVFEEIFLEDNGVDINTKIECHDNPLYLSCYCKNYNKKGPDVNIINEKGLNTLS